MIYCQECGIKNDTSLVVCDNCGVKLDPTKTDNLPLEYTLTNEQYSEAIDKKNKEAAIKNQLPYAPFQFKILQFVNIMSIISIMFLAIIFVIQATFPNLLLSLLVLIPSTLVSFLLYYCVRALNRYDNKIRKIFLIWPFMEFIFVIWLFIDGYFEIPIIGLGVSLYPFYILLFDRQTVDLFLNGIN